MKIYNEKKAGKKSWSIKLVADDDSVDVIAVDSGTGERIVYLISFQNDGEVVACAAVRSVLVREGYDPHEHGNKFNDNGSLVVS